MRMIPQIFSSFQMEWFLRKEFRRMGSRMWGSKGKQAEDGGEAFSWGCRKSPGMWGMVGTKPAGLEQASQRLWHPTGGMEEL